VTDKRQLVLLTSVKASFTFFLPSRHEGDGRQTAAMTWLQCRLLRRPEAVLAADLRGTGKNAATLVNQLLVDVAYRQADK
jgi:hypothetical protein